MTSESGGPHVGRHSSGGWDAPGSGRGGVGGASWASGPRARALLASAFRVGLATVGGWVLAVSAVLAVAFLASSERPSTPDIRGLFTASLGAIALLAPFVYLPGLLWLRWFRRGVARVTEFVLACAIGLNVPVFVLLAARVARGVVPPAEAMMFGAVLAGVGAIFGRSLARALGAAAAVRRL